MLLSFLVPLALADDLPLTPPDGAPATPPLAVPVEGPAPPPGPAALDPDMVYEIERANRLYHAGMTTGAVGGIGIGASLVGLVAGGVAAVSGDGSSGAALLTGSAVTLVGSVIALEVGAPIALVGAGREHKMVIEAGLKPIGGTTAATAGWVCYGAQFVLGFTLPGAYVGAGIQHGDNRPKGGTPDALDGTF